MRPPENATFLPLRAFNKVGQRPESGRPFEFSIGICYRDFSISNSRDLIGDITVREEIAMKKFVWISLASFALGILAAGYVFIVMPEKKAETAGFLNGPSGSLGGTLFAQSDTAKPDLDFVRISDKIGPAVVKLESERLEKAGSGQLSPEDGAPLDEFWNRFFNSPNQRRQDARVTVQGTGFIVSPDGYVITNNHLAEKSEKLTVILVGGENFRAKVVGLDPQTDLQEPAHRRIGRFQQGPGG
jgi:hypothetical protein